MMYFEKNYVNKAIDLISEKDELKADNDIRNINNMIENLKTNDAYINAAIELDQKMRSEYPSINILQELGRNMSNERIVVNQGSDIVTAAIADLNADTYGICVDVLLRHGIIKEMKDFIRCVD